MKKLATLLVAGAVALALGGCGQRVDEEAGGGQTQLNANGEPITGAANPDGPAVTGLNVRVLSDVDRIEAGSTEVATVRAYVTDESRNAVVGQPVAFSATGGVLQGSATATDENGEARTTLTVAQEFRTQDITVTVASGDATDEVLVRADGSALEVTGPANLVEGAAAELAVTLKAGDGDPIVNETVTLESATGNTVTPTSAVTDIDGRIDALVTSENGDDTIRISALDGTVTATHAFSVSSDSLAFADDVDGAELGVATVSDVEVTWTSQGLPVVGRPLRFAITAGQIIGSSTVTTDAEGSATIQIASSSAGGARITVEDAADGAPATHADVEFVATTPAAVTVGASSTRVHTRATSTVTATVTDANGNRVKSQEVVFSSPDLKGGQLNPAFAVTNSEGQASVTFTAGPNATELDEVEILAEVEGTTVSGTMALSVVERVLNVTLGTSNWVFTDGEGDTQYDKHFVVQVADGGGAPVENADVSLSIRPIVFRKGTTILVDEAGFPFDGSDDWAADHWASSVSVTCSSEDVNGNRVLDTGEDTNGNGSLDPQDPASLAAIEGETATLVGGVLTTDATGSGYFRMIYPASNSWWSRVEIVARAKALGVEAEDSFVTELGLPADIVNDKDSAPPNYVSPYGTSSSCADDL